MAPKLENKHVKISLALMEQKLRQECNSRRKNRPPTIHRVHPDVRREDNRDYDPKFVSIGPYHRGNERLQPMEQLKWSLLQDLLNRQPEAHKMLETYIDAVWSIENKARRNYSEKIGLPAKKFVEMLVLDGCFILELLLEYKFNSIKNGAKDEAEAEAKAKAKAKLLPLLKSDLLLLENQIPFFVLEALFEVSDIPDETGLVGLALKYISDGKVEKFKKASQYSHLLHLSHLCQLDGLPSLTDHEPVTSSSPKSSIIYGSLAVAFYYAISLLLMWKSPKHRSSKEMTKTTPRMIPSATKLREAGVRFRKKEGNCLLDVSFKDGTLEIPFLRAEEKTFSLLRNLIAFENCHPEFESKVTAYAMFMDNIIDTPDDVEILVEKNIMESKLGCSKEVARNFNVLRRGAWLDYEHHYLAELFKSVRRYCESDQHRWRAQLVHVYFSNPWARVSFVACVSILIFTAVQTVFATASYYHRK